MLFEARPRRRRGPGLTPLIDVVFLLLVFFMLASRFDREALLPLAVRVSAPGEPAPAEAEVLRVDLDARGRTRIDDRPVDPRRLTAAVAQAVADGRAVRIRPAPETPLQPIVEVLETTRDAGARDVALERGQVRAPGG